MAVGVPARSDDGTECGGSHDGRVHLARQLEEACGAVVDLPCAYLDLEERVGAAAGLYDRICLKAARVVIVEHAAVQCSRVYAQVADAEAHEW